MYKNKDIKYIDYNELEKIYLKKISPKFKKMLGEKIKDDYCQKMIKKALQYDLTDSDNREIFKVGSQSKNSLYPGLYYICFIYIHPLTVVQSFCETVEKS